MIKVTENEDKSLTISWDENDPQESIFNLYTEEDFVRVITKHLETLEKNDTN
jgi:hypothetical protein